LTKVARGGCEIRWKYHEVVSATLLFLIPAALAILFVFFQYANDRYGGPPKTPELKDVEGR
jgi:hypothetical protein